MAQINNGKLDGEAVADFETPEDDPDIKGIILQSTDIKFASQIQPPQAASKNMVVVNAGGGMFPR